MRIIWVPLEPLEARYTADWAMWFPAEFERLGVEFLTVDGEALTEGIETGDVLDAFGTNFWKASQLKRIMYDWGAGEYRPGDVFLFADLWFPGIEMLAYAKAFRAGPPITGILHAGTYDEYDFTVRRGMRPWGRHLETAWMEIVDAVFVATDYHRDLILREFTWPDARSQVVKTGLPFWPERLRHAYISSAPAKPLVVFPHRRDPEKCPELFEVLKAEVLKQLFPFSPDDVDGEVRFEYTTDAFATGGKDAYYKLLREASVAVSFAEQETFGYAMLEAAALGCEPVVPDRLSYPELFPNSYRYNTMEEAVALTLSGLREPVSLARNQFPHHLTEGAIERMVERCKQLPSR